MRGVWYFREAQREEKGGQVEEEREGGTQYSPVTRYSELRAALGRLRGEAEGPSC